MHATIDLQRFVLLSSVPSSPKRLTPSNATVFHWATSMRRPGSIGSCEKGCRCRRLSSSTYCSRRVTPTFYRTVDLVWVVFGFDPLGFRLCVDWDGGDFAFGVVNGVLADTSASEAIPLRLVDDSLCRPTHLHHCPGTDWRPPAESRPSATRRRTRKAVYLVQMRADGAIIRSFKEAARVEQAMQGRIESLVEDKLLRLYAHTQDQARLSIAVKESLRRHTGALSAQQREQRVVSGEGVGDVDWGLWLGVFRRCLDECASQFGPPGHIFLEKATSEMRRDDTSIWQDGGH